MKMNKNATKIVLAQCLSRLGDNIEYIALCLLCYEITGSVVSIGIVSVLSAVPNILFTLFGGAISDHYDKKRFMVVCEFARAIVIMLVPCLRAYNSIYVIYIATFIVSIIESFFEPCCSGYLACTLDEDEYVKMNGVSNSIYQIVSIIGLTLGGFFVGLFGNYNAFYFDAMTFFVSGLTCLFIDKCHVDNVTENNNIFKDISDGIKVVFKKSENIINVLLLIIMSVLIAPLEPYITEYINKFAKSISSDFGIGIMFALLSVGVIIGNIVSVICNGNSLIKKIMLTSVILLSIPGIFLICSENIILFGAGILLIGVTSGCIRTITVVKTVMSVGKEYRSRASSIILLITLCISPLATMLASVCIDNNVLHIFWRGEIVLIVLITIIWIYNQRELHDDK